jgi:hypothetical protein
LQARQWRACKKTILVFPAPKVLETPKSFSYWELLCEAPHSKYITEQKSGYQSE